MKPVDLMSSQNKVYDKYINKFYTLPFVYWNPHSVDQNSLSLQCLTAGRHNPLNTAPCDESENTTWKIVINTAVNDTQNSNFLRHAI